MTDTIMLDVHLPATHTQGALPASMPAMRKDTDMIDASASMLTPETALVSTSHPELLLRMFAGTCHTPAGSDAGVTAAETAKPTVPASAAPRPHFVDIRMNAEYALPLHVSAIELDRKSGADTTMPSIGEDFLGTSAPDVLQIDAASAQPTELPYLRFKAPQLVATQLQAIWDDAVPDALEYSRDVVKRRHNDSIAAGIQNLLMLASEVLGDNLGSSGQQRRAAAWLSDLRKHGHELTKILNQKGYRGT